jgi:hypothetical protein
MAKVQKIAKRVYKVVDVAEAKALGAQVFSENPYNRFALVAVRGESLDNVIAWGFQRDPLERKADARNKDIAMLGKMIGKANEIADKEEAE